MATAKKPVTRSTDPNVRKSPPLSASQFPEGHVSKGNDGNYWTISESANGVKRWVPTNKTASTAKASSSSKIVSQFQVNDFFVKKDDDDNWKLFYIQSIKKSVNPSNGNFISILEIDTNLTLSYLESTLQGFLDDNTYIYRYIPQVGDIILKDSTPKPLQITIEAIGPNAGSVTVSSKMSSGYRQTYTKEEFTRLLVNKGFLIVNFDPNTRSASSTGSIKLNPLVKIDEIFEDKNGKLMTITKIDYKNNYVEYQDEIIGTLSAYFDSINEAINDGNWTHKPSSKIIQAKTATSTPAVETQQEALDRFNTYINNTSNIYYTLPRTNIVVYVDDIMNIRRFQALIGNTVAIDENDIVFKKELEDYLAQRFVITNVKVLPGGRADITDFTFEFDSNADIVEKEDALNDLDNWLYDEMNVRNGIQKTAIRPVNQASTTSSNDELKRLEDLLASSGTYYLTMPKSGVKIYEFDTPNKNYQFYIQLDESQDKYLVEKFLRQKIKDFESVKEAAIAILRTGNLLHVIIEFDDTISRSTRLIEISILDNYLSGDLGIKPDTVSTVQEAETKINDIVFSAPVVPVGTEDQRNATDKLVDEFIAKNENNLKKLSVENVDLLSTIDKTLEFIKAKFGTPAPITSISNIINTASQISEPVIINDIKLMQFIGNDGERRVTEFKNFTTGKSASVFKYFIGDIFLVKDSPGPQKNYIYVKITGAKETGPKQGRIEYLESYLGNLDRGLTWNSRVRDISVSEFDGYIEDGFWEFVPGANENIKQLSEAVSATKTSPAKKRSFSVGDTVRIRRNSQFFGININNPKNEEGEIVDIVNNSGTSFPIKVKWANGRSNTYPAKDLELVTAAQSSTQASTTSTPQPVSGSATASVGDTVMFYASREKTNLTGIVKSIITGTDGKPYLRINVNGKFYLKQQGSVKKV